MLKRVQHDINGLHTKVEIMEIKQITDLIENFAPLELQEAWDCSGFQIGGKCNDLKEIRKILLCVSVTQDIINQAVEGNFDMIIAHHPLFFIPFEFNKNIPIYSAHTNLDKAEGGTTDTMIEDLEIPLTQISGTRSSRRNFSLSSGQADTLPSKARKLALKEICRKGRGSQLNENVQKIGDFLRLVTLEDEMYLDDFVKLLKDKLNIENLRVVNNLKKEKIHRIAFCAGSGADLSGEAENAKADAFVTGDVKYHQALESNVIIIDVGHFESERLVLKKIKKILEPLNLQVLEADEKSPFINY